LVATSFTEEHGDDGLLSFEQTLPATPVPQAEEKATAGRPPPGVLGVAFLKRPPWRDNMEAACGNGSELSHEDESRSPCSALYPAMAKRYRLSL